MTYILTMIPFNHFAFLISASFRSKVMQYHLIFRVYYIPHDEKYTYVVQSLQTCTTKSFEGAPAFAFEALVRINLDNSESVDIW